MDRYLITVASADARSGILHILHHSPTDELESVERQVAHRFGSVWGYSDGYLSPAVVKVVVMPTAVTRLASAPIGRRERVAA